MTMTFRTEGGMTSAELAKRAEYLKTDAKAVVKIINKLRKQADMGSTSVVCKGVARCPRACPVAMSLVGTGIVGVDVHGFMVMGKAAPYRVDFTQDGYLTEDEGSLLARFTRHVDQGLYPKLCIPESEVKVNGEVIE